MTRADLSRSFPVSPFPWIEKIGTSCVHRRTQYKKCVPAWPWRRQKQHVLKNFQPHSIAAGTTPPTGGTKSKRRHIVSDKACFADHRKTLNMSSSDSEDDIPLGKLKKEQKQKAAAASAVPKKVKKEDPEPADAAATATNGNSNGGRKRPAVKYEETSDVSDDDFEPAPKKKKSKAKAAGSSSTSAKTPTPSKKASKTSSSSSSSSGKKKTVVKKESASSAKKKRELKKLEKADRLQHAMQAFLWWDAPEPPAGCQWNTMEHAGVSFPEPYEPHGIKMKYDGKDVDLNPVEEEM